MGKAGSTGSSRLLRAVRFCRRRLPLFWGRLLCTVTSWTRDSNRSPADAPVEHILLRLGVWRSKGSHDGRENHKRHAQQFSDDAVEQIEYVGDLIRYTEINCLLEDLYAQTFRKSAA
jgi:hypothetical protein